MASPGPGPSAPTAAPPRRRPPPLYRLARWVSIAATLVAVLLIAYVGVTIYSASMLGLGKQSGQSITQSLVPGGVQLAVRVNISNPGFVPISGVQLAAVVMDVNNTSVLAAGDSADVTVAAASTALIPLTLLIPLADPAAVAPLVTHDARLPAEVWANVTVSSLFAVHVNVSTDVQWGAPFYGLAVTPQTPSIASNGSADVPFSVSFDDAATFADNGTLELAAHGSGSCSVALPPLPLRVAPGANFQQVVSAWVPSDCAGASWSSVSGSYSTPEFTLAVPLEAIP